MAINIATNILALKDQRVNQIEHNEALHKVILPCYNDKRGKPIDPSTAVIGTLHRYVHR